MLTAEGCLARRQRFWQQLDPPPDSDHLHLADPLHLTYLANFWVDPFSLGAGFGGFLLGAQRWPRQTAARQPSASVGRSGSRRGSHGGAVVRWPGARPRPAQLALLGSVNPSHAGLRIHDRPGDPYAATVIHTWPTCAAARMPTRWNCSDTACASRKSAMPGPGRTSAPA